VAVAFDAGNLLPVAQALAKRYRATRLLLCADDDDLQTCRGCGARTRVSAGAACEHCKAEHGKRNAGVERASAAALAVDGAWIAPVFTADRGGRKLTDFNDLAALEGLLPVRTQVEAKLDALGWRVGGRPRDACDPGGGGRRPLAPIESVDELLERFSLVYGHKSTVFDHQERLLMGLADMRDACTHRELHRRWMESPAKKIVRLREVGFDPAGTDPAITCNLWGGWPTVARSGSCEVLLELLRYLCSHEDNPQHLFDWVLKWLAYPVQHPGAKMKTALVLHGPQGAGKNMFFEAVMGIYGEYGRVVDQAAIEDKFNDWASKKLFLIADEVVARAELYHLKNKLKAFVTGDTIRINPKNVGAWEERNHVNVVFLSNETQPLVIERDDRRYTVIWTPKELPLAFYADVKDEIAAGGIEALHHHLLTLDLGEFAAHTRPPMTQAKADLIDMGMDSTERFWGEFTAGQIDGVPVLPVKSEDLYELYRTWCGRIGLPRYAPRPKFLAEIGRRTDATRTIARYWNGGTDPKQATFIFPNRMDTPVGASQLEWLSQCVSTFRDAVGEYRQKGAA
jgi:putative DNA primase/helicase